MRAEPENHADLLTDEELQMPFGMGYVVAAERLNRIYLADVVNLARVISRFTEQAISELADYQYGLLTTEQHNQALDELIDRFSDILKGRNPRYLLTPWFTDPNQLARSVLDNHEEAFREFPDFHERLLSDPIRELALLNITSAADETMFEVITHREFVTNSVREILNIPESVPLEMLRIEEHSACSIRVLRVDRDDS